MNTNVINGTLIVAISGGSGSGKTTLANLLARHYSEKVTLLSLDSYYKDLSHLAESERSQTNFDHPDSIDFDLFRDDIKNLKKNTPVDAPVYSFETHCRLKDAVKVTPKPIIILEGLYSFFDNEVSDLADYKVYVEASNDIRLIRRIRRDVVERGRDVESVIIQYETTVRAMHYKYIDRQKQTADFIVENNGEVELEVIIESLTSEIDKL